MGCLSSKQVVTRSKQSNKPTSNYTTGSSGGTGKHKNNFSHHKSNKGSNLGGDGDGYSYDDDNGYWGGGGGHHGGGGGGGGYDWGGGGGYGGGGSGGGGGDGGGGGGGCDGGGGGGDD